MRRNERDTLENLLRVLNVDFRSAVGTPIFNAGGLYRNAFVKSLMGKPNPIRIALRRWLPERMRGQLSESPRKHILVPPPPLPTRICNELIDVYRADLLELQEMIGRDLSAWLETRQQ